MISFFTFPEYLQYSLLFINLIAFMLNVYSVISDLIFEAKKRYLIMNSLALAGTSLLFFFSLTANFDYRKSTDNGTFFIELLSKYSYAYMALLAFMCIISVFFLYSVVRWKKEHITPGSIKEAMDKLPAGLCYHNEKGVPKLINHRMDNLCRFITGEPLFDANEFWRKLTSGEILPENTVRKTGYNPIITLLGGNTVSFTRTEREIGGIKMYEIRATDITEQFSLSMKLQRNNSELISLNRRLQEYGENVWDITREREILSAKVNIHDMLGKALLVTRRYIEKGGADISRESLIDIWKGTLYLFEGGFAENTEENNLDELYDAARLMGVNLTVRGQLPSDNRLMRFIMSGARECLTNAVHHAKATELTVILYREPFYFVIEYTNDGIKPTAAVSEGGGLSSLRQSVESEGGIMETDIYPHFVLRLKIPSKEDTYV